MWGENSATTSKNYLSLSVENIYKVIDTVFLDDLRQEFSSVKTVTRNRKKNLLAFQEKLASLKIFDLVCGSGNFLTESYLSLRRLENEILTELFGSQIQLGELVNPIKVSIAQFYGIEINDFAVAVAQTALWIAELQMIQETRQIIHRDLDFLPLKSYSNIHEANALQLDWRTIIPDVDFIIGNPSFVGKSFQTAAQKSDMANIFADISRFGNLDFVTCRFKKAADFIHGTNINAYLLDAPNVIVLPRANPLRNDVSPMIVGSCPTDGGKLLCRHFCLVLSWNYEL